MDNLEGTPPCLSSQSICVVAFASESRTGGNHVREEGRNDVRNGLVQDLDTDSLSTR